jgi:hypothetical protein
MRRKKWLVGRMSLVVALMVGLAACAQKPVPVRYLSADYPIYHSIEEIVQDCDLVVYGTAVEILPSYRVIPEGLPLDKLPPEKMASIGYVLTDIEVDVARILYGPPELAQAPLLVTHLGGRDAQATYIAEAEPISNKDHAYIFFLSRTGEGGFMIVGGPQGRYLVRDGKLAVIGHDHSWPLATVLDGRALESVLSDFERLVSAPAHNES